jgi:hypothetical protein
MKRSVVAFAALAAIAASGSLMASGAQAAPLSAPSALQAAVADLNPATDVAYVCRLVRTRHGLARSCYWSRPVIRFAPRRSVFRYRYRR